MNQAFNISFGEQQDFNLESIMMKLGYNDIRSAIKWCKRNGVVVFTQGKSRLVNGTQFLISFYKPLINQLQQQYPEKWVELFRSFIQQDFAKTMEILHPKQFSSLTKRYKPKSESSKSFLFKEEKQ